MVLSRTKPRKPPTNMLVVSRMVITWSSTGTPELQTGWIGGGRLKQPYIVLLQGLPVLRDSGCLCIQSGMTIAENKENPKINKVLEEFKSVNFRMRSVRLS